MRERESGAPNAAGVVVMSLEYASELIERFMRYAAISTQSDPANREVPSSPGQWELARLLEQELKELGLEQVVVDEHCIVTAKLPSNLPADGPLAPRIGFVAHLDTVDVGLSPDVRPRLLTFTGEDICLNPDLDIWLRVAEHPELNDYRGQQILCGDCTSVLGADNKSAVAVIMTMLRVLQDTKPPHGEIMVAFVPDAEVGLWGSKLLDLTVFNVDFAYTIDSCGLGEVVCETFNAGTGRIDITGVTAHPMSAKGVLVNPLLVATDIMACFDRAQTPENTEGKEGYVWFTGMEANAVQATLRFNIRDFDKQNYEARKRYVAAVLELIRLRHPRAKIVWEFEEQYGNIMDSLGDDSYPVDLLYAALAALNIPARTIAMRGGTDGSALSARGVVTPNYFTGGHNFHSNAEFLPVPSFHKSLEVALKLVELASDGRGQRIDDADSSSRAGSVARCAEKAIR